MVSTKSAHLLPDNSLEAFNGFYCTWKPVKFRWKHFRWEDSILFEIDDILNEKFCNALSEDNKSLDNHYLDANLLISEDNKGILIMSL